MQHITFITQIRKQAKVYEETSKIDMIPELLEELTDTGGELKKQQSPENSLANGHDTVVVVLGGDRAVVFLGTD